MTILLQYSNGAETLIVFNNYLALTADTTIHRKIGNNTRFNYQPLGDSEKITSGAYILSPYGDSSLYYLLFSY